MGSQQHVTRRLVHGGSAAITVIGGSLVVGPPRVDAATFEVTTLDDVVDGGDGVTSLREAIDLANGAAGLDTITFAPGLTGALDVTLGPLRVKHDLSIVGPGQTALTLSSPAGDILYLYNGAAVELASFTLADAGDDAIRSNSAGGLTLDSMTITRSANIGVRIDSPGSPLTITSSTISGNTEEGVNIDDADGMDVDITDSEFDDNGDTGFYADNGFFTSLRIESSSFSDNGATGLYLWSVGGDLSITDSHMDRNAGDGIRVDTSLLGSLTFDTSSADGNADAGANLSGVTGNLEVTESSIGQNGLVGLYVGGVDGNVSITGSVFSDNGSHGVYIDDVAGSASATSSTMNENGDNGLYFSSVVGPVTISGVGASDNDASGLHLRNVSDTLLIDDAILQDNDYYGITVRVVSGDVTASQVTATGNALGGISIAQNAGSVEVSDTTFAGSVAGPGVRADQNTNSVTLDNVTISDNAASGIISTANTGELIVSTSTITGNGTTPTDAAITSTSANDLTIRHATIAGNGVVGSTAAAIDVGDTAVDIDHTILTGNNTMPAFSASGTGTFTASRSLLPVGTAAGATNVESADPGLLPLGDYGGSTDTMLPEADSPAGDAGDPAFAPPPATDQRGVARVNGVIDIGAVESGDAVSVDDATVADDADSVDIVVNRSGPATSAASVTVTTTDGSATAGTDFTATTETVSWSAGELGAKTVTVPILADDLREGDETFAVALSAAVGTAVADGAATVTIIDGGTSLTPLDPARFVDTRPTGETIDSTHLGDGKIGPRSEYVVAIAGRGDVPADAKAVVMNVTAVGAEETGFVTVHPCADPRPLASSLNYTAGVNLGNELVAALTPDGDVCFHASSAIHLTVDVVGYVVADSPTTSLTPARFLDTRPGQATFDGQNEVSAKTTAGGTTTLQAAGRGDVPADAAAVIVNVTAVGATGNGYVTVHPCVDLSPNAASLNYVAGANRGNELVAALNGDGEICLFTSSSVHLTADVVGYVPAASTLSAVEPARLLDTRATGETIDDLAVGEGKRSAGSEYTLQVSGRGGVPADAKAAIVNVTAIGPESNGFVTVHPCVDPRPTTAALNFVPSVNGGNEIIASLDADGEICLFTSAPTHLSVDVVGYLT